MILFQTLTAYMQQGARCRKALEQRSSKVFEIDEIRFSERIPFGCKCKIYRCVRVIGHVCVFCSNFFVQEFCTFARKKKHQLCLNSMNTFRTQISENIKTHRRGCANIFSYLMSPTSILSPSSLVMSTTFVMLTTLMLSLTNISVKLVNLVLKKN